MLAQPQAYSPTPRLAKATRAAIAATVADAHGQSASLTQDVAASSPVAPATWYSSTSRTDSGGLKFRCWRTISLS